jgi:hypothetical protein
MSGLFIGTLLYLNPGKNIIALLGTEIRRQLLVLIIMYDLVNVLKEIPMRISSIQRYKIILIRVMIDMLPCTVLFFDLIREV